jgi:MoaA/NifB/PqqE/SkfB family radical SAM enzyme
MIRYLKDRGTYVLFNTNGTLMQPKRFRELVDTGLDELRVSLDAADRESYRRVRGKDFFDRIVRDVGKFVAYQRDVGATTPRISLWLTGLKETIDQLPAFVRLAATMGVPEVHLQRLVFDAQGYGLARAESTQAEERAVIAAAQAIGAELGVTLDASGATEPGLSLKRQETEQPWSTCRRPWSLMYFTAHGRALPCCIAPFSVRGYSNYTLGDATQQTLREICDGACSRGDSHVERGRDDRRSRSRHSAHLFGRYHSCRRRQRRRHAGGSASGGRPGDRCGARLRARLLRRRHCGRSGLSGDRIPGWGRR